MYNQRSNLPSCCPNYIDSSPLRNVDSQNCGASNELRTQYFNNLTLDCNLNASLPGTTHFFSDPHIFSRPDVPNMLTKFDPQISHDVAKQLPYSLSGVVTSFPTDDPLKPHTPPLFPIRQSASKPPPEQLYSTISWSINDGISNVHPAPSMPQPTNTASKASVTMSDSTDPRSVLRLSSQQVNKSTIRAVAISLSQSYCTKYRDEKLAEISGSDLRPVQRHSIEPTHRLYANKPTVVIRSIP